MPEWFVVELLVILAAGLAASVVCRRIGVSSIVGYLGMGAVLGSGAFNFVGNDQHEVELLREAGVFLLLFTVGLEFSISELRSLAWRLPVGGTAQMLLVAVPAVFFGRWLGIDWPGSVMLAAAASFSSTVLVFKTLTELGEASTPHGRRMIGILLFQDVALVPLLLVVPLLTADASHGPRELLLLVISSVAFIAAVMLLRLALASWVVPKLTGYRSPDLVVLLTIVVLGVATLGASAAGLPPALGAFAAGLCFGGNRWSPQIDALVLPFRETFAVVFFVGLGLLIDIRLLWETPLTLLGLTVTTIVVKAIAAAVAVRMIGLKGKAAVGVGLGLAHVGEFAFVLGEVARSAGLIEPADYGRFALVAFLSLLVTPPLLKLGLRMTAYGDDLAESPAPSSEQGLLERAVVIGAGPVGKQVASYLETRGVSVSMLDRSPVNLYPFSQAGMHTAAGDAADPAVLAAANADAAQLIVVCVSSDEAAQRIVKQAKRLNPASRMLVRCRFETNVRRFVELGANFVVSEEQQAYSKLIGELEAGRT
ncbi:MAG: cation:proton antiporter [Planctomycetota bacterium]